MNADEIRALVEQVVNETIGDLDKRIEETLARIAKRAVSIKNLTKAGGFLVVVLTIAQKIGDFV